jgi:ligand-binding sensor domain-containing protein/serine phosphatase RsbU (regulator of sigma subunit)
MPIYSFMKKIKVIIFYFILFFSISGSAQKYNFKNYLPKINGLVQSQVKDIIQDGSGYLWIATYGGVCRFDGDQFISYKTTDGLLSNEVTCISDRKNGEIWVGTRKGINIIKDGVVEQFNVLSNDEKVRLGGVSYIEFLDNNQIIVGKEMAQSLLLVGDSLIKKIGKTTCAKFHSGTLLIGTSDRGLYSIIDNDTVHLSVDEGLSSNYVSDLTFSDNNTFIVGTSTGLSFVKNGEVIQNSFSKKLSFIQEPIYSVSYFNHQLCVAKSNEIYIINKDEQLIQLNSSNGLVNVHKNKVFIDREGVVWMCTEGKGLVAYNTSPFLEFGLSTPEDDFITSIISSNNGDVLYGTRYGVFSIDSTSNKIIKLIDNSFVVEMAIDSTSTIWLIVWDEGLSTFDGVNVEEITIKNDLPQYDQAVDRINSGKTHLRGLWIDENQDIWVGCYQGIAVVNNKNELVRWYDGIKGLKNSGGIMTFYKDSSETLWIGCGNGLFYKHNDSIIKVEETYDNAIYSIREDKAGNIWCASDNGIVNICIKENSIKDVVWLNEQSGLSSSLFFTLEINGKDQILAGSGVGVDKFSSHLSANNHIQNLKHYDAIDGFNGVECNSNCSLNLLNGTIWFGTINGIYKYEERKDLISNIAPELDLIDIRLDQNKIKTWKTKSGEYTDIIKAINPIFYYDQNHITFDYIGISTVNHQKIKYSYWLEGFDENWYLTSQTSITYPNMSPGSYVFHIKAINADKIESEMRSYAFIVAPPFWETYWFYLLIIVIIITLFYIYIKLRERQLRFINIRLEKKVKLRTSQLKKEKGKVEKQHREITKSINYAKRIQDTILPEEVLIKEYFKEFFVLNQPKDIVGGDFYWYRCFGNISVIATVDCTGHGVPGGFMSMMGSLLLDKIIQRNNLDTAQILKDLNNEIIRVLDQNSGGELQDGMDIALCLIDKENKRISFSGARNGIIIISGGKTSKIDADLFSVGGSFSQKSKEMKRDFKNNQLSFNKGDWVFMYSDGYFDQLSGRNMTSLGMDKFKTILEESISNEMDKKEFLLQEFNAWKGDFPQIDDLLVMGFKME